jgi:hypothetical protein
MMARRRPVNLLALLGGAALIAIGMYLNRSGDRDGSQSASAPVEPDVTFGARRVPSGEAQFARLTVAPDVVALGSVSTCGERRSFEVALANDGDKPIRVDGWISTCACLAPAVAPGFSIDPGDVYTLPIAVEPWNFGSQSHRIDFRVSGDGLSANAAAARLRINFEVAGPLRARPPIVMRPDRARNFAVNLDRSAADGSFVTEAFDVYGVEPRVAQILPPLEPGHGAINIDFEAIDELAQSSDAYDNPAFEWQETADGRRWKSIELTVRTSLDECQTIRVRVRNRAR